MLKISIKPETRELMAEIISYLFKGCFVLLAMIFLLEAIKPRTLEAYNSEWLLLIFGILFFAAVIFQPKAQLARRDDFWLKLTKILFSVLLGLAVIYFIHGIGFLSIPLGLTAIIISYYFLTL